MANLAKRQSTAIERVLSEIPDKSRTRQNLRYAKYKTREHEKVELIGSSVVAVLLGLLFGGGTWGATTVYTALTFISILVFIFIWHWIFAPGAFRDYWEEKAKELPDTATETRRKEVLADRLRDLLREAGEIDQGPSGAIGSLAGMDRLLRYSGHHTRVLRFLEAHYEPETVERFKEKGSRVLEGLLADALTSEAKPKTDREYPKLAIDIKETVFDFVDDSRIGAQYGTLREPCYVTILLQLKNTRPMSIAIDTFKLTLRFEGKEYVSFAESKVAARRLVTLQSEDAFQGTRSDNLNERPPLVLLEDRPPVEGTLQFMFKDLRYMDLLTDGTSLGNCPFTLVLIDTDKERHTAEGVLPAEGVRYVNP